MNRLLIPTSIGVLIMKLKDLEQKRTDIEVLVSTATKKTVGKVKMTVSSKGRELWSK